MSAYAELITHLVERCGTEPEMARRRAAELYPAEAAEAERIAKGEETKRADVAEKREQWAIVKMARAIGLKVYILSQPRASKQTPGLPDLWLACEAIGFCAWWESKRQVGGKRSTSQEEFGAECLAGRIKYGFGDRYEFARWLLSHGFTPPAIPQD